MSEGTHSFELGDLRRDIGSEPGVERRVGVVARRPLEDTADLDGEATKLDLEAAVALNLV